MLDGQLSAPSQESSRNVQTTVIHAQVGRQATKPEHLRSKSGILFSSMSFSISEYCESNQPLSDGVSSR